MLLGLVLAVFSVWWVVSIGLMVGMEWLEDVKICCQGARWQGEQQGEHCEAWR